MPPPDSVLPFWPAPGSPSRPPRPQPAAGGSWERGLARPWSAGRRVAVVLALYGGYFLLGGGLQGQRMPYDAGHYWELAVGLQHHHQSFSLLDFHDPTRGYMAALLQFPALVVRFLTDWALAGPCCCSRS